jgi:hypothetical protein
LLRERSRSRGVVSELCLSLSAELLTALQQFCLMLLQSHDVQKLLIEGVNLRIIHI